jgi:ATP-dependent RNA helicase DHX40
VYKNELTKVVKDSQVVVVVGETGSGKTTQLPQYLHEAGLEGQGVIAVTQPRRVAAISVAHRVADELDCCVGELVGYQVRFDSCTSDSTRIKYMTDGCLLREFLVDPELSKYSIVVLDEAHERSLDTDILFGLVKKMLEKDSEGSMSHCPKIVVMSATLDYNKFSHFFNDCPIFSIPGRLYPVENVYCDLIGVKETADPNYIPKAVEVVMDIHIDYPLGDVLVFLTGQTEIEMACDILFEKAERVDYRHDIRDRNVRALLILPIYGAMPTGST